MKGHVTLGITTAGPVAAALVGDDEERAATTSAQALSGALASVRDVLAAARLTLSDIALVAVCCGPGSFTGLRIGVALAKSIAQARDLPIVGVSSYDVVDDARATGVRRAALVEGKRDFFYARVTGAEDEPPQMLSGSRESLADALAASEVRSMADISAAEQAARVARVGRRRAAAGGAGAWQEVDIDYGGRPNAVVNWERRHGAAERGAPPNASKS